MRSYLLISLLFICIASTAQRIRIRNEQGQLRFYSGAQHLISYQHAIVYPPASIDTVYKRSGFIHPLYAPHGQALTRIQPPDHYHHYGIWNPWTHTLFEGDTLDFWNLNARKGTVRFAKFTSIEDKRRFASFTALHEHVALKKEGIEKVALNERQRVKVYRKKKIAQFYIVDLISHLECATESPFEILAYRYGGLGWRATEYWDKQNSEMLTSEGRTRENADNSKARWIMVYGALPEGDEGGILMLAHPANFNHPEPLRIWDKNQNNGRGDVFANFAPTKDKNWKLVPRETYQLQYRLIVFNGKMDAASAEEAWKKFSGMKDKGLIRMK